MTNHVRMGIYAITTGTYGELIERAREGLAPILRDSPGFVFYSATDVGGGRFVSVSTWETREQAEAAAAKSAAGDPFPATSPTMNPNWPVGRST